MKALVSIPQPVRAFWDQFQAAVGCDRSPHFYEAFHFDDNEGSANELAGLVLAGTKRATAGLLWSFEAEKKRLPGPGDLSVVTDWHGKPLCVIKTTVVAVMPYEEVTQDFAAMEGEGDKSLRYWREVHWAYFGRECQRIGKNPDLRMPVACEQFAVIYPRAG